MNEHEEEEEEGKKIHQKKNALKTDALMKSHRNGYVIINTHQEIIEYVDTHTLSINCFF